MSSRSTQSSKHRTGVRSTFNLEQSTQKRAETQNILRKEKKSEFLAKKVRNIPEGRGGNFESPNLIDNINVLKAGVMSGDPTVQLESTMNFRKLLSIGEDLSFNRYDIFVS